MGKKKPIMFDPSASHVEEEQQVVPNNKPTMENYDPSADDSDLPYIPSAGFNRQTFQQPPKNVAMNTGFIDIDNIEKYTQPTGTQPMGQRAPLQPMPMNESGNGPAYPDSPDTVNAMGGVLDAFNSVDQSTTESSDVDRYAISVAIKTMSEAAKMFKEVQYWLPKDKSQYTTQLTKIGKPIADAITAYVEKIGKLK
jgi:hypothetical protein